MKVVLSNHQEVYGLTQDQRSMIKDFLTFDNPAYKNAKKYGRSRFISIPPYLTYYGEKNIRDEQAGERKKVMTVPIGVNLCKVLNLPVIDREDKRCEVTAKYPEFKLDLREDQKKAETAYLQEQKFSVYPKNIVQLPTGKGKSILALHIAYRLKQKTLILVHKDDLVVGWQKDIKLCFGDIDTGLIKAKSRKVGKQITIATVQTLNRMSEDELSTYLDQFGLVVQDECLIGDTFVCLADGGVKKIRYVCNNDSVIGGKVYNKFSRTSPIYALTASHAIIHGSPTHPTWCVKKGKRDYTIDDFECKSLQDITSDYYVPVRVSLPHSVKNNLSEEEAKLAAMIMCDGHIDKSPNSRRVKVNISNDKDYYFNVLNGYATNNGIELKCSVDCRGNSTYWFTNDVVKNLLVSKWGIPVGKKSNVLSIPDFLYYAPLDTIKAFLEVCFSCEGDLSVSKDNSVRINFNSVSKDFVNGISLLLRKFGIVPNIQYIHRSEENHNDVYRLSIAGVFYNKFADVFTLMDRKNSTLRNTRSCDKRFVGEYYLSPVLNTKDCGYTDLVYDFTVSGDEHSFIANGLYTHNCHHVGLNIFNVIDKFNSRFKLGLSATPKRSDGLDFVFDIYFGGICYLHEVTTDDEDIANVEVRVLDSPFKYKPFSVDGQAFNYYDFKEKDLPKRIQFVEEMPYDERPRIPYLTIDNEAVLSEKTGIKVCNKIIEEYEAGHSVLALFTQKEHINAYHDYLCGFIPEEKIMLYYGDSKDSSEDMMKRAENKEVMVTLATYAKATEGTNVKSWEVLFLVSSLNNAKNVEQATGRIRRRKEGKLNPVIVYDVRYDGCYSLRSHFATRLATYKKLKYSVVDRKSSGQKKSLFTRGYH